LLGAEDFSHIPFALLERGVDIAQCFGPSGFTPWERIKSLWLGFPGLVHSMGIKPWAKDRQPPALGLSPSQLRKYYEYLHMELTPYIRVSRKYGPALKEDLGWMNLRSGSAKFLAAVTGDSPALQELPLAFIDAVVRMSRRRLRIARYGLQDEFCLQESPLNPA